MMRPEWSPTDSDTASLLDLIATGNVVTESDVEWSAFTDALVRVAHSNSAGVISPNELRRRTRGNVSPRRVGAFTHRALSRGLVAYTGEWEISDDTTGRNSGKPCRVLQLVGAA